MKGSLLFLKVNEASQTAEHLETLSSGTNLHEASLLLEQLEDQLEPVFSALREYVSER